MATKASDQVVDFPTLWIVPDWIEQHCPIPDRDQVGQDLELYPWQLWCTVNHYRVRPTAEPGDLAPAFWYRRSQVVMPQKTGKGPWTACIVCVEAVGPALFAGWARGGERWRCIDWGCECGWEYRYRRGEPMGRPWSTPLLQLLATSEDQVANVYRPLQAMARGPRLRGLMRVGEGFIRTATGGRIEPVTSSAQSRLGNPATFAGQDESGLYTASNKLRSVAETQRRGVAGMGGRSLETTNAWDPSAASTAQRTSESRRPDIFRYHPQAPSHLRYDLKVDRQRIHRHVYRGCRHVDLRAIEAEAAELMETDPAQAERFFGNRVTAGTGTWLDKSVWGTRANPRPVPDGTRIVLGFDGSDVDDWTGLRAETLDGYQFTPTFGPDAAPTIWNPADFGGQVPRLEVDAAIDELMTSGRYDVALLFADPPGWTTEIDNWSDKYGEKRVIRWYTQRTAQMHAAAERLVIDVTKADGELEHDGCETTATHIGNARKAARPGKRYVLVKASAAQKIDIAVCSVLAHEAAGVAIAAGLARSTDSTIYTASSTRAAPQGGEHRDRTRHHPGRRRPGRR